MPHPDECLDERSESALQAAQMYYLQDLTMEAIASELHTSRSSVSRLLGHARSSGLVDIQIRSPHGRASQLEEELRSKFGLTAHIVPVPDNTSSIDRLERVAMSAARILNRFFDSNMTLGVAWGSTMSAVSHQLIPKETHNSRIVQLNGAGNNQTTGILYASEILRHFGEAFSAQVQQFPVPAFFDDPRTKEALWRERSTKRVLDIQARMDVVFFGLGSPFAEVPSHVYIGGYLEAEDYRSLTQARVVGDVATVFYRVDGSFRDIALNSRATGPDLDTLRRVPRRVCVASGRAKLPSLRGAIAAGLITDLIVDEGLARRLAETGSVRP